MPEICMLCITHLFTFTYAFVRYLYSLDFGALFALHCPLPVICYTPVKCIHTAALTFCNTALPNYESLSLHKK